VRRILRRCWLVVGLAVVIPAAAMAAEGKSLRDRLSDLSNPNGLQLDAGGTPVTLVGTFDFFGPAVERLAIRGTDFPITSTVPGFSYVYDPQLQVLERSTQLGPVFSERAGTVGKGRVEFGGSFLFANLDEVDGRGFGTAQGLFQNGDFFALEELTVDSFRLETYWFNTYLTYGITDRWDVNVLLPFVYSNMRVRARRTFTLFDAGGASLGSTSPQNLSADDDAFGIGDVLVRTKYRFIDGPVNVAGALSIRTPTGNEEDFAGLGDVTVTPAAILSVPVGPHSLHASLGFEVNADDLERTRARYTIGASFQIIKQVAFLLDLLGSSALVDDEFTVVGQGTPVRGLEFVRLTDDQRTVLAVPRTDLLDAAAGLKVAITDNVVAFGGVIVPLNDDGIRADLVPTGGIEVGF
jgi:hypothetical protein